MIRYKGKADLHRKTKPNYQLNMGKNFEIRLRTGPEERSESKNKSRLKEKRKLLVYKKENKFYIDHAAAYALKLTNVRAVMLDSSHLFEIGLDTLYKFQSTEDIEIEYQELNKKKTKVAEKGDLTDILEKLKQGEYGIGIHGIDRGSSEEKQSIASNISSDGLNISDNSKTILSTSISLGTNEDILNVNENITGYKFGNGTKANVVIAAPLCIENGDGQKIFLGYPAENKVTSGQQYEEHCILDRICARLKRVPPEFILGYYYENPDGTESFMENMKHYSNLTQEQRDKVFNEMLANMDDISKSYNDLIASGNIEQLNQMKEKMQLLGLKSHMVDNSIALAQKYMEQSRNQEKSGRTRRVILDNNDHYIQKNNKETRTRRILLEAYSINNVTNHDLYKARGILRDELMAEKGNAEIEKWI